MLLRAMICPIRKSNTPKEASDYRPISILSVLSKIIEGIAQSHLADFVESRVLLNEFQQGLRRNNGTSTALTKVTDDIWSAMDRRKCTIMVLLDLSKVFDSVNNKHLIKSLDKFLISESVKNWITYTSQNVVSAFTCAPKNQS